jgi:hypothetical protein
MALQGPATPIEQALIWIGFNDEATRARILQELGDDLIDFLRYSEKELTSLETAMASRPAATRVVFGLARSKLLRAIIHWAKDRDRVNELPSLVGHNEVTFREELLRSEERAKIREQIGIGSESRAKEASPGKLKDEKGWDVWEQSLCTQLGILLGVNGVPLSYVIREGEATDEDEFETFFEECIAKARLEGPEFEADALQVHQIIQALTVGENAEQWIKEICKHKDGRQDMQALRSHYRGEGNQSRRVAQAERMHKTLHYKGERSMPFSQFISKVKAMFNLLKDCSEPQAESAKLRFLWDRVQAPPLQPTIQAMKAQLGQNPEAWTFTAAANHLASQIEPVESGRQLSEVNRGDQHSSNIMKDGKIKLNGYSNHVWRNVLTEEERAKVIAERAKSKNKPAGNGKKGGKPGKAGNRQVKQLSKLVKKQAR